MLTFNVQYFRDLEEMLTGTLYNIESKSFVLTFSLQSSLSCLFHHAVDVVFTMFHC